MKEVEPLFTVHIGSRKLKVYPSYVGIPLVILIAVLGGLFFPPV